MLVLGALNLAWGMHTLLKGPGPVNGRCIGTRGRVDIVCASIRVDGALKLAARAWIVGAIGLDNVILHQWISSPAIDSKVTVAVGAVCTRVGHRSSRSSVSVRGNRTVNESRSGSTTELTSLRPCSIPYHQPNYRGCHSSGRCMNHRRHSCR